MYMEETKPHQKMIIFMHMYIEHNTPKMCKFLLMQVKQNICRIELDNDNGR